MTAYIIAFVDIHDRTRYAQEYVPAIAGTLEPYGGRMLASSDEARTLEGAIPSGRIVIIEFPDLDRAHRWYASDVYAPLLSLRESIATTSLVALPGVFTVHD
jgi:uncharacterized protein (DUF1330 family)